jgi:hypothetical protein
MERVDFVVMSLFLIILLVLTVTLVKIHNFMPLLKTCDDDFATIEKCGCVPCSWKDAKIYNGNQSCQEVNLTT